MNVAVHNGKPRMAWSSPDPKSDRPEAGGQEPCLDNAENERSLSARPLLRRDWKSAERRSKLDWLASAGYGVRGSGHVPREGVN